MEAAWVVHVPPPGKVAGPGRRRAPERAASRRAPYGALGTLAGFVDAARVVIYHDAQRDQADVQRTVGVQDTPSWPYTEPRYLPGR